MRKKYYTKTKKGFIIRKTVNGKRKQFCTCDDEQTAKYIVAELKKVNWNEELLDSATYKVLEKERRIPKHYTENRGRYEVRKIIDGKQTNYGVYKTEEMAKKIVKELKAVNWNKEELPNIRKKLNFKEE